jgi:hypothetical protein
MSSGVDAVDRNTASPPSDRYTIGLPATPDRDKYNGDDSL